MSAIRCSHGIFYILNTKRFHTECKGMGCDIHVPMEFLRNRVSQTDVFVLLDIKERFVFGFIVLVKLIYVEAV